VPIGRPLPRRKEAVDDVMKQTPQFPFALRRLAACVAIVAFAVTVLTARAEAQMVAVIVNGDPVTNFDIDQRTKLIQLGGGQKAPSRQEVLEQLIDERLKIQLLKRYNIDGIDKDVDNAFTNMARRMRQTSKQFIDQLERSGVKAETLKSRMKADLVWSQIIRGRYQSSFQFNDKEILARMENRKPEEAAAVGYDYTLRPILFVVPRGSPPAAFEARHKEAEAFRGQFQSCEQGIPIARGMPYVAVRAPVVKGSADLPPALRAVLEKTDLGRLTAPEVTRQGVEVYAVCGKKQSDNAPAKKETRDEMFNEQFESHSKRYLKELRSQAMIEYR
jgi:peptidyl-prolyl cis-trans isomerase SurA